MTTWFTADLHLGHRNIIDYCSRPFADVDAVNETLIERWNDAVAADDTVWVVGDFACLLHVLMDARARRASVAPTGTRCCDDQLNPLYVPWSLWITTPSAWRFSIANPERFTTRFEVWEESIDEPTTRRDKESSTTAQ